MQKTILTRLIAIAALAAALAATVAGCGGSSSGSSGGGGGDKINLVAYSTPKEAYGALIPAFNKTPDGKGVSFSQSYGPSGDQSRAVDGGLPADVVEFSLEPDVTRLVDSGLVDQSWNQNQYKGMVTDSVVVLVTRKGNPKNIKGWSDLTKPGVQVITPNPFTSGGARWNVMAAYGAQITQGKSETEAVDYLKAMFKNVAVQDKSARDALATFTGGKGDVLIAYENEAIAAQQAGEDVDYTIPDQTILIENPIATTKDAGDKAKAFVKYLYTPEAQGIFASKGYRPVVKSAPGADKFPTPKQLFTIQKFGGWSTVTDKFFDENKGIVAGIEKDLGVSTSK
jgi:sulfate transport system substrate-binding protein